MVQLSIGTRDAESYRALVEFMVNVGWSLEASSTQGKKVHSNPEIVKDHNGTLRLEMPRDHPCLVQLSRYQLQS